jgi:hypothetical protein
MNELFKTLPIKCYPCKHGLTGKVKECYACKNNLVDEIKDHYTNEVWECHCEDYHCFCEENDHIYCPICNNYVKGSSYLKDTFGNHPNTLWMANMITHYRHSHTSWNKRYDGTYKGHKYSLEDNYDEEKSLYNERAKRQIIRKCKIFMNHHNIRPEDLFRLKGDDPETVKLANKLLDL